eukprot:TRINITY_DN36881_c0_g1_i1.p1 TRINITY_DN36881_c0_g1~~TRINITY_DN36881_c0_g1_i1.p1  ORF type:complete len:252 (+),score=7.53 TRINITY_DN36881_c0_g1_i1:509-1264(+)
MRHKGQIERHGMRCNQPIETAAPKWQPPINTGSNIVERQDRHLCHQQAQGSRIRRFAQIAAQHKLSIGDGGQSDVAMLRLRHAFHQLGIQARKEIDAAICIEQIAQRGSALIAIMCGRIIEQMPVPRTILKLPLLPRARLEPWHRPGNAGQVDQAWRRIDGLEGEFAMLFAHDHFGAFLKAQSLGQAQRQAVARLENLGFIFFAHGADSVYTECIYYSANAASITAPSALSVTTCMGAMKRLPGLSPVEGR